jgi:hypothetical protein
VATRRWEVRQLLMFYLENRLLVKITRYFSEICGTNSVYYNHDKVGRPKLIKLETLLNDIPLEVKKQSSLGTSSYYLDAGFDNLFDLDMDCLIVLLNIKFTFIKRDLVAFRCFDCNG